MPATKKMLDRSDENIDVVLYYLRKKSKLCSPNEYRFTTVNCLFKTFINEAYNRYYCSAFDDNLTTQEHMARGAVVSAIERSIKNIIKGFSIPTGLPWHLVDEVYIPVNSDGEFHWVLAIVVLKERLIHVYDSSMGTRDSQTGMLLEPNVTFKVEFTQDIMQQQCDSLDCGMYVVAYAEYLSDGIPVSKIGFRLDYLRTRYRAL
ncbi:hypothetical protein KY290_019692 [Solanum tuberosum]|uniref:Ubiquitin-like protease family profile domain-containing protein n=1 Tax=Solanum tuberosum TaxID=4113 RepID=A0ABQ7VHS3_SOLTU|nr:hypothetical protein KY290_019692 [Solanum tuberosum]